MTNCLNLCVVAGNPPPALYQILSLCLKIVNSKGEIIKIQITKVEIKRFCDIDEEWAKKEGEGDLSLAYWQKEHKEFFTKYYENFTTETKLVCEEFVLI